MNNSPLPEREVLDLMAESSDNRVFRACMTIMQLRRELEDVAFQLDRWRNIVIRDRHEEQDRT